MEADQGRRLAGIKVSASVWIAAAAALARQDPSSASSTTKPW
jgi:hypothetical protein